MARGAPFSTGGATIRLSPYVKGPFSRALGAEWGRYKAGLDLILRKITWLLLQIGGPLGSCKAPVKGFGG